MENSQLTNCDQRDGVQPRPVRPGNWCAFTTSGISLIFRTCSLRRSMDGVASGFICFPHKHFITNNNSDQRREVPGSNASSTILWISYHQTSDLHSCCHLVVLNCGCFYVKVARYTVLQDGFSSGFSLFGFKYLHIPKTVSYLPIASSKDTSSSCTAAWSTHPSNSHCRCRFRKSAKTIFFILFFMIICYLPFCFYTVALKIIMNDDVENLDRYPMLRTVYPFTWTMVFLNSTINPALLYFQLSEFRIAVRTLLRKLCRCRKHRISSGSMGPPDVKHQISLRLTFRFTKT